MGLSLRNSLILENVDVYKKTYILLVKSVPITASNKTNTSALNLKPHQQ